MGTEELAQEAGVTRGALYHQFADKRDLFRAVCDQVEKIAAKGDADTREKVLAGTIVQALFYESAQAIFDILQVPVWGRRGDAADRLAGFLIVGVGSDISYQLIVGTAIFFQNSGKTWTGSQFASVNSPEAQRFYNFLCMAYGSDTVRFGYLAESEDKTKDPIIPRNRAVRCSDEYTQVRSAFNLRIMPYVDPDLLIRLRATQWLLAQKTSDTTLAGATPYLRMFGHAAGGCMLAQQALALAREAGLEEQIRPLVELRLADLNEQPPG